MAKLDWWVWLIPGAMVAFFFFSPTRRGGYTFVEGVLNTRFGPGVELLFGVLVLAVAAGIKLYEWRQDDRPWIPEE